MDTLKGLDRPQCNIIAISRRALAAGVLALAMAVGLTSVGAFNAAAQADGGQVVGRSDAGKITGKVVGTTATGDRVKGSFTPIKVVERDGAGLLGQLSTLLNQILGALNLGV